MAKWAAALVLLAGLGRSEAVRVNPGGVESGIFLDDSLLNSDSLATAAAASLAALVNARGTTWRARAPDGPYRRPMLGAEPLSEAQLKARLRAPALPPPGAPGGSMFDSLPDRFDAREQWPNCTSMDSISDQGHCGSCWAFGSVEAISDRECVGTGRDVILSPNDVLACCSYCGNGCHGGQTLMAYDYWVEEGIVSSRCDPYFDPVGCKHPGCVPVYDTPQCIQACSAAGGPAAEGAAAAGAAGTAEGWETAKYYGESAYVVPADASEIMYEIMTHGPVTASYTVYMDFALYASGIYQHISGDSEGRHAVKIIGWGSEDGVDYWLVANSWRREWGEGGFFRILRGVDECGIESQVVAGRARALAPPSLADVGAGVDGAGAAALAQEGEDAAVV